MPFRTLVVEDSMLELVIAARDTQMTPKQVLNSVLAWQFKYQLPITFCSGRHYAAATIRTLLLHAARYAADETRRRVPSMVERVIANELHPVFNALADIVGVLDRGHEKRIG
jgi:hypothetical protein